MLDEAQGESTPEARVAKYLSLNMARFARIREHDERALASLSDLRAMEEPMLGRLMAGWRDVFRRTRALWDDGDDSRRMKDLNGARAHVLLENTFWIPAWINRYDIDQFDRVEARLMDMFRNGIAPGVPPGRRPCWMSSIRMPNPGARHFCWRRLG